MLGTCYKRTILVHKSVQRLIFVAKCRLNNVLKNALLGLPSFRFRVFATVERIICWNHSAGLQGLAAAREGWRPRSKP